jgi:Ran GTPase-activating protein (RanGAP) involved in mRNA processing and transport
MSATAFLAKNMPKLTKLNLSYCMLSDEGYADLAASTKLTKLRELNLTGNPESIVALINSPTMANLTHLHIVGTHDGADILTAIAQSPSMAHLQHLSFKDNCAGDKAVIAFAKSTTLKSLTWLDLGNNEIGPKGAKALCTSRVVSQLKYLSLAENPDIGNSLATTLASPSSTLHNITELSLVDTGLDDEGALQLLATPNLRQLSHLLLLKENYDWMDEDDGMSDEELITGPVRTKYWARFNDCRY